jgi:8-amino-7-oxononanoate synthase
MHVDGELEQLTAQGLLRTLRPLPATGGKFTMDGRTVLNLSSNDYLNLANDPRVKEAAIQAVEQLGCGATASRLMSGHLELHEAVEAELAQFLGTEATLVFGSGFLTNVGVLTALLGRNDVCFADRLNHASLIDGMRLAGVNWHRYRHKDLDHLSGLLEKTPVSGRRIIVTDSVFSMDGDIAPLEGLAELAAQYEAVLVVDEAHAVGVLGPGGAGLCRSYGDRVRPDIVIGTFSKSFGGYGGFAGCSKSMRAFLVNRARSFIYSTGLPPACLGAGRRSLEIIRSDDNLGPRLMAGTRAFRERLVADGLTVPEVESQILPVHVGENKAALDFSRALWDHGILATAVRPPTVPKGTARLRLSVTLAHNDEDLARVAELMAALARKGGLA